MKQRSDYEMKSAASSMKIGVQGGFYPVPADVEEEGAAEWLVRRSAELGCTVLQVRQLPKEPSRRKELGELAASLGIELETSAPGVFQLAGPEADPSAKSKLQEALREAKLLGMPVVRTGYGRLKVDSSRFNRSVAVRDHMNALVPSLKEAARMAEAAGLSIAVENHCDFTGRELAQILDAVDSPFVGAALDTANGFTVYCDPNDDIEALAPYALTTHIKDMAVIQSPVRGVIPFLPYGCTLGEGHVDLPRALELLAERSPRAEGLHLIIEPGWMKWDAERDIRQQELDFFEQSIRYLNRLRQTKGQVG
ncbi:sugar phosphate isomerase/epimerase family protein [Paenibacillus piri]|uniref:Sugar phosphate isomerase/epimerase n=1 Tax=Paenibacillus piri TaxID=2547395 RepID=A0A4R5KU17_9BACL|nr:sugar phosphate isomerase/epimerase family protein [Paenibacillus piri]TDF98578.1 sugar phosphate isomerase/epimerase [Paenibacillus piri]